MKLLKRIYEKRTGKPAPYYCDYSIGTVIGWKYYNHAVVPNTPPHENPDLTPVNNGSVWNVKGGKALLARWTTGFDCGYETEWWYVIKDLPFDIGSIKSKYRYEINKGLKHFTVQKINPAEYAEEISEIQLRVWETYPSAYRPNLQSSEVQLEEIRQWKYLVFGAFYDRQLCGFQCIQNCNTHYDLTMQKALPEYEKYAINAALIATMLKELDQDIINGMYICDGERNVLHKTSFQDYLEKYFGFRKAYCSLHVCYRFPLNLAITCLYPFRAWLRRFDPIKVFGQLNALLRMEEIHRSFQ